MRFLKPTIEPRSFGAALSVAVLMGSCYSPPAILERRFHPEAVYLRHANFEFRFEFLDSQRLLDRARWLNSGAPAVQSRATTAAPAFPAARRAPDLTAIEITVFHYGNAPASVDFQRFRIHPSRDTDATGDSPAANAGGVVDSRAPLAVEAVRPIYAAEFRQQYAGRAIGALAAIDFAFVQNEVHRFSQPLPDWYANYNTARTDDTVSEAERSQRAKLRDQAIDDLSRAESGRGRLDPGGEIRGIVLFPLLAENRNYVLRYAASRDDRGFAVPELPFAYRTRGRYAGSERGAFATLLKSPGAASADDMDRRRAARARAAREAYIMHEQLRAHDRLRQEQIVRTDRPELEERAARGRDEYADDE